MDMVCGWKSVVDFSGVCETRLFEIVADMVKA